MASNHNKDSDKVSSSANSHTSQEAPDSKVRYLFPKKAPTATPATPASAGGGMLAQHHQALATQQAKGGVISRLPVYSQVIKATDLRENTLGSVQVKPFETHRLQTSAPGNSPEGIVSGLKLHLKDLYDLQSRMRFLLQELEAVSDHDRSQH